MTDKYKAWLFQNPKTLYTRFYWCGDVWAKYGVEMEKLVLAFPRLHPDYKEGEYLTYAARRRTERIVYTDGWGCKWDSANDYHLPLCVGHPIKTIEDAKNLVVPEAGTGFQHGTVFLRYTDLRGFEEAMLDFAEEGEMMEILLEKILAYNIQKVRNELALAKETGELFIHFLDDLGMQTGLPTGPERWRRTIGKCYKELLGMCKAHNKMTYLHSDGCMYEIIPDLREYGLDVINPQFRANPLDKLLEATRGSRYSRIALELDVDRQLLPFATPDEIEAHLWECVHKFALPEGGVTLIIDIADVVPFENIERIFEVCDKIYDYYK